MLNISDYIVETILFAHVLPISREYAVVAFVGRKERATCNRLVLALLKSEDDGCLILDEISISSCEMVQKNINFLLAAETINVHFIFRDADRVTVSYTDYDLAGVEADTSEKYTFQILDF